MKKFRVSLIITCLFISLVGCAGSSTGKTVLNLALREGVYSEVVKSCLAEFEKENNVLCHVQEYSEAELRETIYNSKKNEGTVDLCMVDGSWMAQFCEDGVLTNLSDYGYSMDSDIIAATTDIAYYNGDIYLAPYYGNVTVLMYNKRVLQENGYEVQDIRSLTDIYDICKSVRENGKNGFLYRGDTNNNLVVDFLPILLSYGVWVVDEENQPILDDPFFASAVSYYNDLIATGEALPRDDLMQQLVEGKAAMAIGWPGWYANIDSEDVGFCALSGRAFEGAAAYNSNVYGIWTLGVSATSQHQKESVDLLKYLMDQDVQRESVAHGGVPCRYSVLLDSNVVREYPEYASICDALETGQYRPITPKWNDFSEIFGAHLRQILDGDVGVESGLEAAQAELVDLMR